MLKKINVLLLAGLAMFACTAEDCSTQPTPTANQVEAQRQEIITREGNQSVGMPNITMYSEKRQLKEIFELRDRAITTFSYTQDMNGNLHFFCNSIGYGLPASTQFDNPQQVERHTGEYGGGNVVIAQPDPNGLYSPSSSEATWVFCVNPKTHKAVPVYVEPRVIVSPFEMTSNTGAGRDK